MRRFLNNDLKDPVARAGKWSDEGRMNDYVARTGWSKLAVKFFPVILIWNNLVFNYRPDSRYKTRGGGVPIVSTALIEQPARFSSGNVKSGVVHEMRDIKESNRATLKCPINLVFVQLFI